MHGYQFSVYQMLDYVNDIIITLNAFMGAITTILFRFVFLISIYGVGPCCFSCVMLFDDVYVRK
jgi:hypothetical protein